MINVQSRDPRTAPHAYENNRTNQLAPSSARIPGSDVLEKRFSISDFSFESEGWNSSILLSLFIEWIKKICQYEK